MCVHALVFVVWAPVHMLGGQDRALGGLLHYSGRSLPEPGLLFSRLD